MALNIPNLMVVKTPEGEIRGVGVLYNTNPPDPRDGAERVAVVWIDGGVSNVAPDNLNAALGQLDYKLSEIEVVEKKEKWYSGIINFFSQL